VPYSDFDAPTQSLLHGAFDAAWLALGKGAGRPPPRRAATMTEVTRQLLVAAEGGERDHDRLVRAALEGFDLRHYP
jgi:hypothetical protein